VINGDFVELALGTPAGRGVSCKKSELSKYIIQSHKEGFPLGKSLYRSMYLYPPKAVGEKKFKTKEYVGERAIDWIVLDVDKGRNTDEYTLDQVHELIEQLLSYDLNPQHNFNIYFSGTGYNIHVPNSVFGFEASPRLPIEVKDTVCKLFQGIDTTIYGHVSLYRVPWTQNQKSGLYKVPIKYDDFVGMNISDIHQLAKSPIAKDGKLVNSSIITTQGTEQLKNKIVKSHSITRMQINRNVRENTAEATCLQKIYNMGPTQGNRHVIILRLASHYKRKGIPLQACKAALLDWNAGSLNDSEIVRNVESVYNRNYQYGCNDALLKEHCSPLCKYYKNKDYLSTISNSDDMQAELERYVTTNFKGKKLEIGALLGLEDDLTVYPGELITIYGPTGCNKTTLIQNLVLGYCAGNNKIIKQLQIDTLFLSLELSLHEMHKRNLSIVNDCSPRDVERSIRNNVRAMYDISKEYIDHIKISTLSPSLEKIEEDVKEFKPKLLVIDYLDLVDAGSRGEYERLNKICHGLRNLATNQNIIIVQLAQVARGALKDRDGKEQNLTVNSGKGSGAIENASSKVISIEGRQGEKTRTVTMHKNSNGNLFQVKLKLDNLRLRRDFEAEEAEKQIIKPEGDSNGDNERLNFQYN
tara:strand:- start:11 stop:1930 length:1920 start_codon:yes stop_codon:yes gene_type:complete